MGATDLALLQGYAREQQRRALSKRTIKRRRQTLDALSRWLGSGLLGADSEDIELWLDSLGVSPRTRALYLSYLSTFYDWCRRAGHLDANPTEGILRPRLSRTLPRPISDDDLALAVGKAPERMRAWLLLAALEGLRAQEISRIRREDVLDNYDPPMISVEGAKGGHRRVVPLHPDVLAALHSYGMPRIGWLWPGKNGPMTAATVTHYVSRYLHDLDIDATCHQLRHWFGTHLYAACQDLRLTQEMMGHQSPTTTAGYVAWSPADAVVAVRSLGVNGT